jgi:PAS domain S-box-containing protein
MGLSIKIKIILVTLLLLITTTIIMTTYLAHLQQEQPLSEDLFGILFHKDFVLVSSVTLVISLIILIAFSYTLIEPVDKLIIGTQLVGQGKLDYQIRKYSNDEIGRLVEAFNEMIRKLRSSIEKETKSSEKALLESTKAGLIIDSMADGVIVTDKDHKVVLFNRAAEKIFEISASKILGKNILHMTKSGIATIFYDLFEDEGLLLNKKNRVIVKEFLSKQPQKMLKATIGPLKHERGKKKMGGSVIVIEDITALREIENMKTEFVSIVSHELRTPLTSIRGYAELLHLGKLGDLDSRQQKAVDIINTEADRLTALINDILDLSKLETGKVKLNLQDTNLVACLDQSPALHAIKEKGIDFKKFVPVSLPRIYVDQNKLTQVFTNLLSNAVKFTKKKGRISVRFTNRKDTVYISVRDSGIGIAKKHIPHLFDKFYQVETHLRRHQGGTGLGLPIVKEIVTMHGGFISVDSKPKKGTTISFTIPKNLGEDKKIEEKTVQVLKSKIMHVGGEKK